MRICKNKITDIIRTQFGANPLKVPDSTYQPLMMLEIDKKTPRILGRFEDLIRGEFDYDLPLEFSDLAEVSGSETNKIGVKLGFNILGNFIKAFGGKSPEFNTTFKKTKKLSFTFSNVKRKWFSVLKLGKLLSTNNIVAADSIFVKKIMENKHSKLALITDVIISNNFSFKSYNEQENEVDIDLPVIEGIVADADFDLTVEKVKQNEIKFNKKKSLTFAFSCVELIVDQNGNFKSGNWIDNVKIKAALDNIDDRPLDYDIEIEAKLMIDNDDYNPLLIE